MEFKTPKELGQFLRNRRKEMKLTQAQAAALCNVGVRFIIELEAGKETASFGKLLRVVRGYGLILNVGPKGALGRAGDSR